MKSRTYSDLAKHKEECSQRMKELWSNSEYRSMQSKAHSSIPSPREGKGISVRRDGARDLAWRKAVKERDLYTCQSCKKGNLKGLDCQAHHIKPFEKFPELRFELSNGITYCSKCHNKIGAEERTAEMIYVVESLSSYIYDLIYTYGITDSPDEDLITHVSEGISDLWKILGLSNLRLKHARSISKYGN